MSDNPRETIEGYRRHAIEACRMLLDVQDEWSPVMLAHVDNLLRSLEMGGPPVPRPIFPPDRQDMNRSLMVLISGMVSALACVALRSDQADQARVAITEIRDVLATNDEPFLADVFDKILRFE